MNRALSTRVRTLERKAGVTDLSRLSDADLDARMRDLSARLLGLPASHNPDPDEQRLDQRIRQLVASLAAEGADVTGYYGAPNSRMGMWCAVRTLPRAAEHGVGTAAPVTGLRCRTGDAACTVDLAPDLARQRDWSGRAGPTGSTGTTRPRRSECGEMHASSIACFAN